MQVNLYEVGGCVRDSLLGVPSKDIDYAVEIPEMVGKPAAEGFAAMRSHLIAGGYTIFVEKPEFLTIRARHPESRLTLDFVLCRREAGYSDGRRPDAVFVGTLKDDLDRRDFTVNAMARSVDTGELVDLHNGQVDLANMELVCVGDPLLRMREDALRALRAMRFHITRGFALSPDLIRAMGNSGVVAAIAMVSVERRESELRLCFQHDTMATLTFLGRCPPEADWGLGLRFTRAALAGIKLNPTHKHRLSAPQDNE